MTASNNTTAVPNTLPPFGNGDSQPGPKIEAVEVGMFRLPGVKVDLNQYTQEQVDEMRTWARENGAYDDGDRGLFSWRQESKRDWFILRWS
jgi:hypothetical protein